MTAAEVIRLPVRPRPRGVVSENEALAASGITGKNGPSSRALRVLVSPKPVSGFTALDRLLADGTLDVHHRSAALAYGALRRRYDRSGGAKRSWRDRSGMSDEAWQAVKRDHARLIRAAGAERFVLDRLCLDGDVPMACEVERVRVALGRVAK